MLSSEQGPSSQRSSRSRRLPGLGPTPTQGSRKGSATAHPAPAPQSPKDLRNVIKELVAHRLPPGAAITIDGRLDEPAWKAAESTGPFVDVRSGQENPGLPTQGSAKLLWDDKFLYVGFEVSDKKVHGGWPAGAKDAHLWEKDTVEMMIDPDGDGDNKDYYEIQVNPQNLVFDTQYDELQLPERQRPGPLRPRGVERQPRERRPGPRGTLDDDSDTDQGYTVEMEIPWASFTKAQRSPPAPGTTWRMNFYAMKNNGGTAWSPHPGDGQLPPRLALRQGPLVDALTSARYARGSARCEYDRLGARAGAPPWVVVSCSSTGEDRSKRRLSRGLVRGLVRLRRERGRCAHIDHRDDRRPGAGGRCRARLALARVS